jgi:uncharacterized OB-fold protein
MKAYRCSRCGQTSVNDPGRCHCGREVLESVEISGRGKVYSWTTLHAAAESFEKDLPFQIAIIQLEEGPRVTARIEGSHVEIDDEVRFVREQDGAKFFALAPGDRSVK